MRLLQKYKATRFYPKVRRSIGGITMDKDTQEALIIRLNWILSHLHIGNNLSAEEETEKLIQEIKLGTVAPF